MPIVPSKKMCIRDRPWAYSSSGCQEYVTDSNTVNLPRSSKLRTRVETEPAEPEDEYEMCIRDRC